MLFNRIIFPIVVVMASVLAAPVQPKAGLDRRFIYASPAIATFGDEGPVEEASTEASIDCVECF
ncbi:hypothetical protein CORC01_12783 [Colletotrichum orchidophilum]|uniref:Uncharacterized protein n=1 Tax=Colletotrichum orchidophilum TaxID=1209926 RepID=A0A1G4AS71_9PEZI|nr:uncharacterized protein CORC01_12783 [Colletotrichum orchidophilum]OHE91933.1 hypothetical protein CORC01_12783 [Colletotrichum orchidophilum]